jgi:hypothetical protein
MATVKTVFVEMLVIIHLPTAIRPLAPRFEQITNGIVPSIGTFDASRSPVDFVIPRVRLRDYVRLSGYKHALRKNVIGWSG